MRDVYFKPESPGWYGRCAELYDGDTPPRTWKAMGWIDLWSDWSPLRDVAACRVVSSDGVASVDTQITRELWESMRPQYRGRRVNV